jgi:ABC-2 type transport system permease protein
MVGDNTPVRRYLTLLRVQLRASLATAMQYRIDFFIDGAISLWWMLWTLVPLLVVYNGRQCHVQRLVRVLLQLR